MKKAVTLLGIILFSFFSCKKTEKKVEEQQVLGTMYPDGNIWISAVPGSKKKSDQVALVYDLEEVEGLEITKGPKGKVEYLKLKTSTGKIGYGVASRFVETVLFATKAGVMAYKKPTLTAPTKGKMDKGAICYVKESQGDWSKATCYSAKSEYGQKPTTFYSAWIQNNDPNLSKNSLLGQSALSIRKAKKLIAIGVSKNDPTKFEEATKELQAVVEKGDTFSSYATEVLQKLSEASKNEPQGDEEGKETGTPPSDTLPPSTVEQQP
ncbi:MAG: lipoprotein LenA [Spirochaetota bacterium]